MERADLRAKQFSKADQIGFIGGYLNHAIETGGARSLIPWVSLEMANHLLDLTGDVDVALFPKTPVLGDVAVVKTSHAAWSILHEYDFSHLAPGDLQRRMFGLTRGSFILDRQNREEWRKERHIARDVFSPKGLEKDADRLGEMVGSSVDQFKRMDEKEKLSTRTRGMVASLMMGSYLGKPLSIEKSLKMVKSYENFFRISALSVLGGTKVPILNELFKKSLHDFYSVAKDHVSKHMFGHTPFQENILKDLSQTDLLEAVDRVKALMAGMNSITNATQWLLYMLGSDVKLQQQVRKDIANETSDWDKGLLELMAIRYPIALYVVRQVTDEFSISDVKLSRDTTVIFTHLNYKPDVRQERRDMPNFDLQFGSSPRVCIGKYLSKILLSDIVREFLNKTHSITAINHPKPVLGPVTLRPSEPFKMNFNWKE